MKDLLAKWKELAVEHGEGSPLERALWEAEEIIDAPVPPVSRYSWKYHPGIIGAKKLWDGVKNREYP